VCALVQQFNEIFAASALSAMLCVWPSCPAVIVCCKVATRSLCRVYADSNIVMAVLAISYACALSDSISMTVVTVCDRAAGTISAAIQFTAVSAAQCWTVVCIAADQHASAAHLAQSLHCCTAVLTVKQR
jgi:hypothetical protein